MPDDTINTPLDPTAGVAGVTGTAPTQTTTVSTDTTAVPNTVGTDVPVMGAPAPDPMAAPAAPGVVGEPKVEEPGSDTNPPAAV